MMNKTGRVFFIFNDQGVKYPSPFFGGALYYTVHGYQI